MGFVSGGIARVAGHIGIEAHLNRRNWSVGVGVCYVIDRTPGTRIAECQRAAGRGKDGLVRGDPTTIGNRNEVIGQCVFQASGQAVERAYLEATRVDSNRNNHRVGCRDERLAVVG